MVKSTTHVSKTGLVLIVLVIAIVVLVGLMVYSKNRSAPLNYHEESRQVSGQFYKRYGKRWLDLVISIPALVVLSPVMLVVAFLVRRKLGSPVIFRQERPGLEGKPFMMYKFRTMTNETDAEGKLLSDSKRLTPFGRFLRRSSLDELPELFNVIKGEMSLIGPRPLLMKYLERYTPEQFRRHDVLPGITGWAQINGRNAISWEEKFTYDVWYVDHCSLRFDIKILFLTALKVLKKEGISAAGHVGAPEFMGAKKD